jgi:hypothetical protein
MALNDDAERFLAGTRDLIREARALMDAGDSARTGARNGVIGLYEGLCAALDGIDAARVQLLLGRIAEQVEQLNGLSIEVDRLRRLRQSIRAT